MFNSIKYIIKMIIAERKKHESDVSESQRAQPSSERMIVEIDGTPAKGIDFEDRFRDVICDPINALIEKHPSAGTVCRNWVTMHNGLRTAAPGTRFAYYGDFAKILIYNRGVHEPLEEFCFQQLLRILSSCSDGIMLELGAYWGHYSMWLKHRCPGFRVILVEPEPHNLECARVNFAENGINGEFVRGSVSQTELHVDSFCRDNQISRVALLHSDIQGFEAEMLEGARSMLMSHSIDYMFISTHGVQIHETVKKRLIDAGYRVEIDSCPDSHSTSFDGLVVASGPNICPIFRFPFIPIGRKEIYQADSGAMLRYLLKVKEATV